MSGTLPPQPPGASAPTSAPTWRWRRTWAVVREYFTFARALLRSPGTVGAVCPSSKFLAREMVHGLNLAEAGLVVELGPGTGAFTQVIAERLGPAAEFLALELDAGAVAHLRGRFPRLRIEHDSAENLRKQMAKLGRQQVDYVISGLPWAIFPPDLQARILTEVLAALAPGGRFVTFAYVHARRRAAARRFWYTLTDRFARVEVSQPVWANVPLAVVYRAWKQTG